MPSLRLSGADAAFQARFAGQYRFSDLADSSETGAPDPHKLGQKTFYDDDAGLYETHMMRLNFWRTFDRRYTRTIRQHANGRGLLIEVGGGSGRQSIPLRDSFDTILSFDISEQMVRRAMRRLNEAAPFARTVHYFVADAENIPVRSECASAAVFSGILHHVAAPDRVVSEAVRILAPGGRFIGMENNRTIFRPIFDRLMQVKRLWNEKAHPEHFTISGRELQSWFAAAGVSGTIWTSVFVPPHLFNLFPAAAGDMLLTATDALGKLLPGLRDHGGLVLFAGEKPPR